MSTGWNVRCCLCGHKWRTWDHDAKGLNCSCCKQLQAAGVKFEDGKWVGHVITPRDAK